AQFAQTYSDFARCVAPFPIGPGPVPAASERLLQGGLIAIASRRGVQHRPDGPVHLRIMLPCATRRLMNPAEFHNIARSERDFWWYRGMRGILARMVDPVAPPPGSRVLEAGCGTGYQSKLFGERYQWRMVPMDLGRGGLEYARRHGLERLVQA